MGVGGEIVDLKFYRVSMMDKFVLGDRTTKPKAPYNILIQVDAKSYSDNSFAACKWNTEDDQVSLSWIRNGEEEVVDWSICQTAEKRVSYFFATFEDVENFTIMFPGGISVSLDSLEIE
jgi:hypothetical protein